MICGIRLGGKSTEVQRYAIKRAIKWLRGKKGGSQFICFVRYAINKKKFCSKYFVNIMAQWYPDFELVYKAGEFWLTDKRNGQSKCVGYCIAINESTDYKSTGFPYVDTFIYEEFLNLQQKYIKSKENPELEVDMLIELIITIARGNGKQFRDDVRCFLISNNYYINNPFFSAFGFVRQITDDPTKQFYISNREPKAILEITHNHGLKIDIAKGSTSYGNTFEDLKNELRIVKGAKVPKPIMQLTMDNKTFISIGQFQDNNLIVKSNKPKKDCLIFSCSEIKKKNFYNILSFKKMAQYKTLFESFNNNWLYYADYESYILFYNIMHF